MDTENEIIISYAASTQLGLLKVLCHNKVTQHRHLHAIRKQAQQPENTSATAAGHTLWDHTAALFTLQECSTSILPL